MKKKIPMFIAILLLAVHCTSPKEEPVTPSEPTIKFASTELVADPEGGVVSVKVEATSTWAVSSDGQDWYKLTSSSQIYNGESIVKISVDPNFSSTSRKATLTMTSGAQKASLTISQDFFVPELTFSTDQVSGGSDNNTVEIKTTATAPWTVDDEDIAFWFSVSSKTITKGEGELKVTFHKSYVDTKREAFLHFRCGNNVKELKLVQSEGTPIEGSKYVPSGYQLDWQDDFSGSSDNLEDNWRFEDWAPGHVNNELQRYVPNDRRTAYIENGALNIVARKDGNQVISARMNSRESWLYGYMEASIWLPKGKGTWPAFWMMPLNFTGWPDSGEIDIMEEVGVNPNYVSSSLHANAHVHTNNTQVTHEMYCEGAEDGYHVYAMEWTRNNITTYVDGKVQLTYNNRNLGHDDWPYDAPFYIILNLAWGGDWGGMNGVDESALPCTMKVDYVRVYKK